VGLYIHIKQPVLLCKAAYQKDIPSDRETTLAGIIEKLTVALIRTTNSL